MAETKYARIIQEVEKGLNEKNKNFRFEKQRVLTSWEQEKHVCYNVVLAIA
jgi:hypothetical protein